MILYFHLDTVSLNFNLILTGSVKCTVLECGLATYVWTHYENIISTVPFHTNVFFEKLNKSQLYLIASLYSFLLAFFLQI